MKRFRDFDCHYKQGNLAQDKVVLLVKWLYETLCLFLLLTVLQHLTDTCKIPETCGCAIYEKRDSCYEYKI